MFTADTLLIVNVDVLCVLRNVNPKVALAFV